MWWVRFVNGFAMGGFFLLALLLVIWLVVGVEASGSSLFGLGMEWVFTNLRYSTVPFLLLLAAFCLTLFRLREALGKATVLEQVLHLEHWLDLLIGLFFGVGVIWTAIGMRAALTTALGGLNAQAAEALGAFELLQRLIDGGILLALSTTIVGGIGGYVMKIMKSCVVGAALRRFYFDYQQNQQTQVLYWLERIALATNSDDAGKR